MLLTLLVSDFGLARDTSLDNNSGGTTKSEVGPLKVRAVVTSHDTTSGWLLKVSLIENILQHPMSGLSELLSMN